MAIYIPAKWTFSCDMAVHSCRVQNWTFRAFYLRIYLFIHSFLVNYTLYDIERYGDWFMINSKGSGRRRRGLRRCPARRHWGKPWNPKSVLKKKNCISVRDVSLSYLIIRNQECQGSGRSGNHRRCYVITSVPGVRVFRYAFLMSAADLVSSY